jgi:hypothetical protein
MLNLLIVIIPHELNNRLIHSWMVFWPPWQDRSVANIGISESERAREVKSNPKDPRARTTEMSDDKEKQRAKERERGTERPKKEVSKGDGQAAKELTEDEKSKMKEKERVKRKALEAAAFNRDPKALTEEERLRIKEKERARRKAMAQAEAEEGQAVVTLDAAELTESEKARLTKDGIPSEAE